MRHTGKLNKDNTMAMAKETMLELVQDDNGKLVLRPMGGDEEPFVSIEFSEQVKQVLGDDIKRIGHEMIQAAIQSVMHQQFVRWHAQVHDEKPTYFS